MSLNRRQALLAILLAPSGTVSLLKRQMKDQNAGTITALSNGVRFIVTLADEEKAVKSGGIFELEITYNGERKKFSAKELWEALEVPV